MPHAGHLARLGKLWYRPRTTSLRVLHRGVGEFVSVMPTTDWNWFRIRQPPFVDNVDAGYCSIVLQCQRDGLGDGENGLLRAAKTHEDASEHTMNSLYERD